MSDNDVDERRLLQQHLLRGALLHLATCSSDQPWTANCWYAADDDLSLIFLSRTSRRHSTEILANPRVAAGIVDIPAVEGLGQKVQCVTVQGIAEIVPADTLAGAYGVFRSRWPAVGEVASFESVLAQASDFALWRIRPVKFVLFDEVNFPAEPRRELVRW
jgi:uncharacterized protein YhbP (UPF0306 family)